MTEKYSQAVISKVENGFIFTLQGVKRGGIFDTDTQEDKMHFVAKNEKEVNDLLKDKVKYLVTKKELKDETPQEEELEDEEDRY